MRGEFTVHYGHNYDAIIEFSPQRKLHEKKLMGRPLDWFALTGYWPAAGGKFWGILN